MALYVQETGSPGTPSIVFLHGVGASGWMWKLQTNALADFHCLVVDLPGHGKSNHIPWLSFEDTAAQIANIIQARATDQRAHVVGLSLGGYIALVMLATLPQVVDRVVASGVTSEPMPNRTLLPLQLFVLNLIWKRRWFANMHARSSGLPEDMKADLVTNMHAMSMDAYRKIAKEAAYFSTPPTLAHVDNLTLVVAGSSETDIIKQAVVDITHMMPNAQGRLAPGLGHGWNVENPDLFSAMVRAWIIDQPLPQALRRIT